MHVDYIEPIPGSPAQSRRSTTAISRPAKPAPICTDRIDKASNQVNGFFNDEDHPFTVAAGYALYGPVTMLVLTVGNGVVGFTPPGRSRVWVDVSARRLDDGTSLPESDTIVEYLADASPGSGLRPGGARARARARSSVKGRTEQRPASIPRRPFLYGHAEME